MISKTAKMPTQLSIYLAMQNPIYRKMQYCRINRAHCPTNNVRNC